MSEQAAVADPTPAVEAPVMEASRGPLVNLTPEQRAEYKTTGILPTPKTEEAAPSPDAEPTGEAKPAGDSETPPVQEKPKAEPKKQTAEERIAQLEATIEKIRKGSGLDKPKAESEPAKSEPKPEYTRPKPTAEAKTDDGKPKYESYEDYIEDLADWKAEQREATSRREQFAKAQNERLNAQIEDGRARYENFDEVIQPAANEIWNDPKIHADVKGRIGRSKILADLMFTLGENKVAYQNFVKLAREDPQEAIDHIVLTEALIRQELEGKTEPAKTEVEPPAKPITKAPKPPAEAGGRGTTPPDTLQAALEGSGGKLNAGLKAEFLRRDLARLKG